MSPLGLNRMHTVLCLGAHADDIEIGCGGTILRMLENNPKLRVVWVVFSSEGLRRAEAEASAHRFLQHCREPAIEIHAFRDRYFPAAWPEIKDCVHQLATRVSPDLIFTHRRDDAHQDHRVLAELTWCAFRNHLVLEYEIPKYEGDLGQPNVFVPIAQHWATQKAELILAGFPSQRDKPWFSADTFLALARLRGVECNAADRYAEAFYARKLVL